MSDTVVVSIISTLGVLISVSVSVSVTRLENKAELEKIKRELEQEYAKLLFEQRVKAYPELFSLLSGYSKVIRYEKQSVSNLMQFRDSLDEWNNKSGIFFTESTARLSGKFRYYLRNLIDADDAQNVTDDDWSSIRKIIRAFEDFIRAEMGVVDTQPAGVAKELEQVYQFIDRKRGFRRSN
jgi:hypothetical protein